ncbi:hypothetical protein Xbed_03479 [Xenorhabdus beddingii]|uniref:Uncharacterized protein n=1 Tax=Xenorhabdus beddingii TaxID=40578 RepID=A0A1Y2SC90_9GAMM|nr:hypothetical protein Xbed_03479 [Xenorhabdus beddingii]
MLLICQLQQLTPDQRALGKVEGRFGLKFSQPGNPAGVQGGIELTQVTAGQGKTGVSGIDVLAGLAFDLHKTGTQTLMAGHQTIQCNRQSMMIERTGQAQCCGNMVGETGGRVELGQKPQALLGKGQRQGLSAVGRRNGNLGESGNFSQRLSQQHQHRPGKQLL